MPFYGPEYVVINEGYEYRAKANGKSRVVITVKSEPIIANLDPRELGKPVAAAIVHHLREKIGNIAGTVGKNTERARLTELAAFVKGKPWSMKRNSGGRTGSMPPAQSERPFYNSGRMAKSIVGSASEDGAWRINVAANRLDDSTSGGARRIYEKLIGYVPELANPALLLENDIVRRSIENGLKGALVKARETKSKLTMELVRSAIDLVRTVSEFGDALAA